MPKGVYPHKRLKDRDPKVAEQIRRCLEIGRTPPVRQVVKAKLKAIAKDPKWRAKVGDATLKAMHRPEVRRRHLEAMKDQPVNFKHGNGQVPAPEILDLARKLEPLGFIRELPIKTRGHGTGLSAPTCYKVDFGNPRRKIAVEVDGASHRGRKREAEDRKKTQVLNALGWSVARVKH